MIACQKSEFSLPEDEHYLNCAYMAPLSRRVEAAGLKGVRRKQAPSRISTEGFFTESDQVRELFARLINAPDPHRIALVPSVSYAVATAALNTPSVRGGNIVVAQEQFPSNVYTWRSLCAEGGMELRTVAPPVESTGRGEEWNRRLLEAIDEHTAVVALGHVHWTDGTLFSLERLGARAREVGAALVVDGTQSVGALPFDVQRFRPDLLVCAGYKWLMGPYSIGVAYFGPRYDGGRPLEQNWISRKGSENFGGLVEYTDDYQPAALRYDVGERSNFILLPMLLTALEQVLGWGPEKIQQYCGALTRDLVREARELGWVVEDEEWRGSHLFGLRAPPGVQLTRVEQLLRERRVLLSRRGTALRVSPHLYNDAADVEALVRVLREASR